jgi:hypothetical protein
MGIVGREQRIPRMVAREATLQEVLLDEDVSRPLLGLIKEAQAEDSEVSRRLQEGLDQSIHWTKDEAGLLHYKGRVFVPEEAALRQELLMLFHDDPLAGHFGIARALELLQRKFHWRRMDTDVKDYASTCNVCQGVVAKRHKP